MTPLLLKTVITESAQLLIVVVALATIAVSSSSSDINSDILIYWSEKVKKRSLTWAATNELTNGHVRRFFMSVRWSLTHTVIVDICSPCLSCVQLRVPAHMRSYSSPTGLATYSFKSLNFMLKTRVSQSLSLFSWWYWKGRVTMTTESSENGAVTSSCMLYAFHWIRRTCDYSYYCMLFSSKLSVRIRFNVWLVSGYAHVFILLSVVILILIYWSWRDGRLSWPSWLTRGRHITPCTEWFCLSTIDRAQVTDSPTGERPTS